MLSAVVGVLVGAPPMYISRRRRLGAAGGLIGTALIPASFLLQRTGNSFKSTMTTLFWVGEFSDAENWVGIASAARDTLKGWRSLPPSLAFSSPSPCGCLGECVASLSRAPRGAIYDARLNRLGPSPWPSLIIMDVGSHSNPAISSTATHRWMRHLGRRLAHSINRCTVLSVAGSNPPSPPARGKLSNDFNNIADKHRSAMHPAMHLHDHC